MCCYCDFLFGKYWVGWVLVLGAGLEGFSGLRVSGVARGGMGFVFHGD